MKWEGEESSPTRAMFVFRNGEDNLMALVHASKAFCNKSTNSILCSHCEHECNEVSELPFLCVMEVASIDAVVLAV